MTRAKLGVCSGCAGFVPAETTACPHCGRRVERGSAARARVALLGGALGGGAIAFTLMACYGLPPCPDGTHDCHRPPPTTTDDAGASMPKAVDPPATPVATPPDPKK